MSRALADIETAPAFVLGVGGDNSNRGTQSFFEGALLNGYSTNTADNLVQQDIVATGYTGVSSGGGPGSPIIGPGGKCVDVPGDDIAGNRSAAVAGRVGRRDSSGSGAR